jgi:hypothetical protein
MKNFVTSRLVAALLLLATLPTVSENRCLAQACGTIVACPGSVVVTPGTCSPTPCSGGLIVAGQCSTVVVYPCCQPAAAAQNTPKTSKPTTTKSEKSVAVQYLKDGDTDWTDATLTGLGDQISLNVGEESYTLETGNLVYIVISQLADEKQKLPLIVTFTYQTSDCKLHTVKGTVTSGLTFKLNISKDKDGQLKKEVKWIVGMTIHFNRCCTPSPPCSPPPCCCPPLPCQKKMVS